MQQGNKSFNMKGCYGEPGVSGCIPFFGVSRRVADARQIQDCSGLRDDVVSPRPTYLGSTLVSELLLSIYLDMRLHDVWQGPE